MRIFSACNSKLIEEKAIDVKLLSYPDRRINRALESGQATLDRQLELYREGKTLERECDALLKNAENELARASGKSEDTNDHGT